MASLTNVSFLALVLCVLAHLGRLHVGAVTQLSLLVLKVRIVRSVRPRGKVIVVPNDVVVRRRHTRQAEIVHLVRRGWHTAGNTEALCSDLGGVEARAEAELSLTVDRHSTWLHALVDFLLGVNVKRIVRLATNASIIRDIGGRRSLTRR